MNGFALKIVLTQATGNPEVPSLVREIRLTREIAKLTIFTYGGKETFIPDSGRMSDNL